MLLKPLPGAARAEEIEEEEPKRTCEACGREGPSSMMINCIIVIGSPGHPLLLPFQCAHEEHWSCSATCWRQIAHACIDEHMHVLLMQAQARIGRQEP